MQAMALCLHLTSWWPAVTEDGTQIIKVQGYQDNKKIALNVVEENAQTIFKEATRGDAFFISKDDENQIIKASVVALGSVGILAEQLHLGSMGFGNEGSEKEVMCGVVKELNFPNNMLCRVSGDINLENATDTSRSFGVPTNIILVDKQADKISVQPNSEIKIGDIIVERSAYNGVQEIIVFRL